MARKASEHCHFIEHLVAKSGPEPHEYSQLDGWISSVHHEVATGLISQPEVSDLRNAFGDALSTSTMQGFALRKPHGYPGDFEVIDRIYQQHVSPEPHLAAWDRYYQQHAAPKAVRNRKTYFHEALDRLHACQRPVQVLNIASGPGRCMFEWLSAHPSAQILFTCIDIDPGAIAYASRLNEPFRDRISFTQMNVLRFKPTQQFDLIWASGIFDYFSDAVFQALVRRLVPAVAPGGQLIIGNFSDRNPSRPYMELLGDWRLHYRTADSLVALALGCGVQRDTIRTGAEPEGVNLFLHINNPG